MKHHYPMRGSVPKWAQIAYERHWITLAALLQIPLEGKSCIVELLYTENPLFKLLKKTRLPFGATAAG
jgi:hypothetical protein